MRWTAAADEQLGSLRLALLDVAEDAITLTGVHQRSHDVAGVRRVAVRDALERGLEHVDGFVVMRLRQQHARGDRTPLAAVHADHRAGRHRGREVGVVEDHVGGFATELEKDLLQRLGTIRHDAPADRGRTGEADHVDARVVRQHLPDGRRIARRHDVEHARWDVGLLGGQAADERRAPRRIGGGLEDHGVARRECGRDLRQVEHEREVPRCDGADHTDGLVHDLAVALHPHELVGWQYPLPFVTIDEVDLPLHVLDAGVLLHRVREHDRGAHLGHELGPQRLLLLVERVLELLEAPLPERGVRRPVGLVERPARRFDRPVHVVGAGVGDLARDLLGGRVDVAVRRARRRLDELPVDQHPRLGCQLAHSPFLPVVRTSTDRT